MPISLPTERVLERCGLWGTGLVYSGRVSSLSGEFAAALGPMIRPESLADDSLTWTLSQAVMDLVAADFVEILAREPGAADTVTLGDLRIEPGYQLTAEPMRSRGWARLLPFLKPEMVPIAKGVLTGGERK